MYTLQEIKDIAKRMSELRDEYSDYSKMKEIPDIEKADTKLWSDGHTEPLSCDYLTELFDNTVLPRKLLKATKDKSFKSLHYVYEGKPVYSEYYDNDENLRREKIYINTPESRIEVLFDSKKQTVQDITLTLFDDKGRPTENYSGVKVLQAARYTYEGELIVKAERFNEYFTVLDVVMYDDDAFDKSYMIQPKKMNPELVEDYAFIYEDKVLKKFTRTDYCPKQIDRNTWKIRRSVIKKYIECGIHCLGEAPELKKQ